MSDGLCSASESSFADLQIRFDSEQQNVPIGADLEMEY
jgi:hypothetical protein